jgi:hypothetical protein
VFNGQYKNTNVFLIGQTVTLINNEVNSAGVSTHYKLTVPIPNEVDPKSAKLFFIKERIILCADEKKSVEA